MQIGHRQGGERLTKPSDNGANNQDTAGAKPTTNEVEIKGHIVIPTPRVYVRASKGSVGSMA